MGFGEIGVGLEAADAGAMVALGNQSGGKNTAYVSNTGMIQPQTPPFITTMNNLLQNSLNKALNYSQGYTNQAIQQQTNSLGAATGALNTGLTNAIQGATNQSNLGLSQYQALQAPYAGAGYGALDAYEDSLGLQRPQMGSQALASNLLTAANAQPLLQQINTLGKANPIGTGLTNPSLAQYASQVTPQQIQDYINQNISTSHKNSNHNTFTYTGIGNNTPGIVDTRIGQEGGSGYLVNELSNNPTVSAAIANQLAQTPYQQALQQYNSQIAQQQQTQQQQTGLLNQLQTMGYNPTVQGIAQGYSQGLFTK